jgi:hypothetical protein
MLASKVSISQSLASIASYTAFLLGAIVVTQSQLLEYAVLLILLEVSKPVTAHVFPFTLVTHVELVKNQLSLFKSDVFVGIDKLTAQV